MKIQLHRWLGVAVAWLGITSASAYDFQVDGIYYDINADETTVTVTNETGFSASYSGEVIIPQSVTFQGNTYIVTSIGSAAFMDCTSLTSIAIPEGVTSIGARAFHGCTGLTSVTIPESVTSIGMAAFLNCTGLTSIAIPNSVTSIKVNTFEGCTGLTSVTIPEGVTSIGSYAFHGCTSLTEIGIPESVTEIGNYVFGDCTSLTSVTIPNSVTSIGMGVFRDCTGLISVTWNARAYIKVSASPFQDVANNIETFVFGESVERIPAYLCENMSKLTSVTIPSSVTSIGSSAFYNCDLLETIKSYSEVPPAIEANTFSNYNATLYVPVDCGNAYREAEHWANFTNIVESIDSRVKALQDENARVYMVGNTLHIENGGKGYQVYTLAGQLVYTGNGTTVPLTNTGIYIVHMEDFIQKVIVR